MKMKVALIAPGNLPIPSILDGAIETLATQIVIENEIHNQIELIVFSYYNHEAIKLVKKYKNTRFVFIKGNSLWAYLFNLYFRILRKIFNIKELPLNYFLQKCIKIINNDNFDFVLLEGGTHQVLTLHKYTNAKLILHVHADILNISAPDAKRIFDKCYKIITVSNYIKKRVLEIDPAESDKIIVLPNGVDLGIFDDKKYQHRRGELRNKHNIKECEKVILFCGRLSQGKGIKELMLACEKIESNYKLVIAGSVWFHSKFISAYERELIPISHRLGDKVVFLGYIPNKNMPEYYAMADISVCPSLCNDAAPLVPLEAFASGLPVIATNIGGLPEHVDISAGDLIEVDEQIVDNIASAIEKYLTNEIYYQQKKKCTKRAVKDFSKENYYKNFVNILREI